MRRKTHARQIRRLISIFTVAGLAGLYSGHSMADAVLDMCADPDKVCVCAANKLKTEVGDKDYALYEAIGSAYLSNKNGGMNMVDAWDAAVKVESDRLGDSFINILARTNKTGSAHREIIEACKN